MSPRRVQTCLAGLEALATAEEEKMGRVSSESMTQKKIRRISSMNCIRENAKSLSRESYPIHVRNQKTAQLLASCSIILCRYGAARSRQASDLGIREFDVFSEADHPLNEGSTVLCPETAFQLTAALVHALELDDECIVYAVIFLERLTLGPLLDLLSPYRWRNVVIIAFTLASKAWYDEATWLQDVSSGLSLYGYSVGSMSKQEYVFLKCIDYDTTVKLNTFANYWYSMLSIRSSPTAQKLIRAGISTFQ